MAEEKSGFRDSEAPPTLTIVLTDSKGNEWGRMFASAKEFSSGSVGYYANGKIANPDNPNARYQIGANITLIGSKPK
jgi:hypothetical protein